NQQMIVYGGFDDFQGLHLSDVRVLSLPAAYPFVWSTPAVLPGPIGRAKHTSIMDPLASRMIVFGGEDSDNGVDGSVLSNESWTFDPASNSWSPLLFSGTPSFRSGHSSVYDAANRRMLMFGGETVDVPK